jgi:hypothetical protein
LEQRSWIELGVHLAFELAGRAVIGLQIDHRKGIIDANATIPIHRVMVIGMRLADGPAFPQLPLALIDQRAVDRVALRVDVERRFSVANSTSISVGRLLAHGTGYFESRNGSVCIAANLQR